MLHPEGVSSGTAANRGLFVAQLESLIQTPTTIDAAALIHDDRIEVGLDCGSGVVGTSKCPRMGGGLSDAPPEG
ncbi:MAG: hypothetical protein OEX04_00370 [Acidimicrobiia bacterium]|nr:hypothetical protein [Acidimicrobiia bacterium]MDH4305909.1 hypothetical protein [Acidimicrobiia bacterium]MDH5293021.1 hypothetical protein [Acidimicrobiia bacterium]